MRQSTIAHRVAILAFFSPLALVAQKAPVVGPPHGTVIVVGGGNWGPEVTKAFLDAAGGPDAFIIDVPNAEGVGPYNDSTAPEAKVWRQNGAHNVHVLYTTDRKLADADSFVAMIKQAKGVWFEGGRQFRYVDAYGGTKTEAAFNDVLARGGVVGGSSAGASILGDFMVRGAPSNDNMILAYPGYEKGFAYLKNVGIDQHVVARERLPDLADSIISKHPTLLGISGDEGTAWVIQGDSAHIIGRNKTFVYNGKDKNDPGKPFLTLHPGDDYNLATRHVTHRASEDSPLTPSFINSLFTGYRDSTKGGATVLVARDGEVFVDTSFGISAQPKYMPPTAVPQVEIGDISHVFSDLCTALPPLPPRGRGAGRPADTSAAGRGATRPADTTAAGRAGRGAAASDSAGRGAAGRGGRGNAPPMTPLQACISGRLSGSVGLHRTAASPDGKIQSSVDELYRFFLGLDQGLYRNVDLTTGWAHDTRNGVARLVSYGTPDGKRGAFIRIPDQHATIIVLTNDNDADARGIADKIFDKLESAKGR